MSETTKPTPGPWKAVRADLFGDDPDRWSVCTCANDYFVASIENGAPGDTLDTESANARLIAAAPELLAELLFWFGRKHEGDCWFTDKTDEGCPDCREAENARAAKTQAVIAKATGGTP